MSDPPRGDHTLALQRIGLAHGMERALDRALAVELCHTSYVLICMLGGWAAPSPITEGL